MRKRKFKSAAHKAAVLEHEQYLAKLAGNRSRKSRRAPMPSYATPELDEHRRKYPSLDDKAGPDATAKREKPAYISDEFTVAIGYNKGTYEVVPVRDLDKAGKK